MNESFELHFILVWVSLPKLRFSSNPILKLLFCRPARMGENISGLSVSLNAVSTRLGGFEVASQ